MRANFSSQTKKKKNQNMRANKSNNSSKEDPTFRFSFYSLVEAVKQNDVEALAERLNPESPPKIFGDIDDNLPIKNISQIPTRNIPLLHIAAFYDALECLNFLVSFNEIDTKTPDGFTPLHYAVFGNAIECTSYLCKKGANILEKSKNKITPLYLSIFLPNTYICNLLIQNGAFSQDIDYNPLLRLALRYNKIDFITLFVDILRKKYIIAKIHGSILMTAISECSIDVVKQLLDLYCDVSYMNNNKECPLSLACKVNNPEIVQLLVSHHADTKVIFNYNRNFVHIAAMTGNPEILRIAVGEIKNFNKEDSLGRLPAFYITNFNEHNSIECFDLLYPTKYDVKPETISCNGVHILAPILADQRTLPELVSFWIQKGIDLNYKIKSGHTLYQFGMIVASESVKYVLNSKN